MVCSDLIQQNASSLHGARGGEYASSMAAVSGKVRRFFAERVLMRGEAGILAAAPTSWLRRQYHGCGDTIRIVPGECRTHGDNEGPKSHVQTNERDVLLSGCQILRASTELSMRRRRQIVGSARRGFAPDRQTVCDPTEVPGQRITSLI